MAPGGILQVRGGRQRKLVGPRGRRPDDWLALLTVVVTSGVLTACGVAAGAPPVGSPATASPSPHASPRYATSTSPSPAVQNDSLAATEGYRRFIVESAQTFVADSESLQSALSGHDLAAARTSELAAQAEFDALRPQVVWGSETALDLDGRADQFPPGTAFMGLHRIEQGLWGGTVPNGAVDALVAEGPAIEYSLARTILTPQLIARAEVYELDWVDSAAIPGQEEQYSHLDTVDVDAGVHAAQTGFELVEPLGDRLATTQTHTVAARFDSLDRAVAALGTPGTTPDSAIPGIAWEAAGQQVDATASALAVLASQLGSAGAGAGFGSYGRY